LRVPPLSRSQPGQISLATTTRNAVATAGTARDGLSVALDRLHLTGVPCREVNRR
jgi:hypothetical protein